MLPIKKIRKLSRERGYGFNLHETYANDPPRLIVIGERHGTTDDTEFQEKLITLVKPEVVLHEFYRLRSSTQHIEREIRRIMEWKKEYEVKMKRCDLSAGNIRQFHKMAYAFMSGLPELADEPDLDSIIIDDNAIREMAMGKIIRSQWAATSGPLIAIVGGYHVRPESRLHQELRVRRPIEICHRGSPISYVTINQDDRLTHSIEIGVKFFEY